MSAKGPADIRDVQDAAAQNHLDFSELYAKSINRALAGGTC